MSRPGLWKVHCSFFLEGVSPADWGTNHWPTAETGNWWTDSSMYVMQCLHVK